MAVTSKRDKYDRALAQAHADAASRNAWLAKLPVEPDEYHAPIGVDPSWDSVVVGLESIEAPIPAEEYEHNALHALCVLVAASSDELSAANVLHWSTADTLAKLDDFRANAQAAQRAALREPTDHGKPQRLAVLVEQNGVTRKAIVSGTPAEIRQAIPDADTLAAWKALGVSEVPVWNLNGSADIRQRMTWVSIDAAPKLLRMESVERAAQ